ncbi:MAG TPA: flippase-like domain-containing protein [Methanoregulaceae archaeon]|nr:flippase-like domain-containing protein [Methanoregulaceae archaeon]HQP81956.1 flippase-like domain-containing protein [Methanoregulaceae archaeon]
MDRNQKRWLWISLGFSAVVLVAVLYFTVDAATISYLRRLNPFWLILALCTHVIALCFWALRIKFMSRSLGYRVGFFYSLNLVFANMLLASITPSQAGGEPVRIHELYKAGVKVGDATAIVLTERILDGIVLGIGGAFFMFVLGSEWRRIGSVFSYLMYISWIIITIMVIIFIYSVKNPGLLKRIIHYSSRWFTRKWESRKIERFAQSIDSEVDNFHNTLADFLSHGKAGLVFGLIFTTLFWFCEFVIVSILLVGLSQPPIFIESLIVQLVIAVIMMIPLTPGASGIAEISFTSLYGLFVNSSILGILVVLWRSILFYFNILLGLISGLLIVQREARHPD